MLQRFLCPVLVSRETELSALEDALLAANRNETRIVMLEGEAGLGKSRLAAALTERARKLGNVVLSGGCSEAEVSLPYLPFVEAFGNYIATQEISTLGERLGPARQGLTQLFPQLAEGPMSEPGGDPVSAKLRLFESVVALLAIPARERGVLLIIEDAHWSDAATRELLDHIARRGTGMRLMVLMTYRIDEIDRKHPLLPLLQAWRRSGIAERVRIEPLTPEAAASMISAILDDEHVGNEFRDMLHARSEGNPFVLEEMLKEAIDRGDVFRKDDGRWDRRAIEDIRIPDSVKDTILLRVGRLSPECVEVLQAASVLGRGFTYRGLLDVSGADDTVVQRALQVAVGQQLVDEDSSGGYRWRHALTQEAIYDDLVLPRRQALHSRAADVAAAAKADAAAIAFHLLGAGRFEEAVPACLAAAEEAEKTLAYDQAIDMYERALPHLRDQGDRGRVLCLLGTAYWSSSQAGRAEPHLVEGIANLEAAGFTREIGRPLTTLGRCRWELNRSPEAKADFERAREILEQGPPSADLAHAYIRIAGLHAFELDFDECLRAAEMAIATAEKAGALYERVWAMTFVSLGQLARDPEAGIATAEEAYRLASGSEYHFVASNILYNDAWMCVHLMIDRLDTIVERFARVPQLEQFRGSHLHVRSYVRRVHGELRDALADSRASEEILRRLGFAKFLWRARINNAEVLYELGRYDDAGRELESDPGSLDLQDIAYEAAVQLRLRHATGRIDEAVAYAHRILEHAPKFAPFRETLALGAETFVWAGMLDEAARLIEVGRAHPASSGAAFLDAAEARVALARGDHARAVDLAARAAEVARTARFRLDAMRASIVLGAAQALGGDVAGAGVTLQAVLDEAVAREAVTIAAEARAAAVGRGIELTEPSAVRAPAPGSVPMGERLITSMFADVRNYTEMTADTAPHEMAERIGTLYRWAATEVERNDGVVNRFAGDAVMATFNVQGTNLDHTIDAVRAALSLRDKASLADLPIGIGIAVGPAVVGTIVAGQDMMVTGVATNLAARLQTAAAAGELILSEEAYRRAASILTDWGLESIREELTLKGFEGPQVAYRVPARAPIGSA